MATSTLMGTVREAGIRTRRNWNKWDALESHYIAVVACDDGTMLEVYDDPTIKRGDRLGMTYSGGHWIVTERLIF